MRSQKFKNDKNCGESEENGEGKDDPSENPASAACRAFEKIDDSFGSAATAFLKDDRILSFSKASLQAMELVTNFFPDAF
jgi:hypothetical protein